MWCLAKVGVDIGFSPPAGVGASIALVKGFVMYLLVAGSITAGQPWFDTSKNAFPLLPKTSPASIAIVIEALQPAATTYFAQLAIVNDADILQAEPNSLYQIRSKGKLIGPPGNLL